MFKKIVFLSVIIALFSGCVVVEDGEKGVKKIMGNVKTEELGTGLHLYFPLTTSTDTFNVKEIAIDLDDLRPKAADDLSLSELDVTVYFQPNASMVAENMIKYIGQAAKVGNKYTPAYMLAMKESRAAAYAAVAKIDSMKIHKNREAIADKMMDHLKDNLPVEVGEITRIIIRAAMPDTSIEESIQKNIKLEKELEAKEKEKNIATKDAEIEIERAKGIAKANETINGTLTNEYLQHEYNQALKIAAENGNLTVVTGVNATQLIQSK